MAVYTRPKMVFMPENFDTVYNPALGLEPDSAGWTLDGTDYSTVTSEKLVITGGGATATKYYQAITTPTAATAVLIVQAYFQADSSVTDAWIKVQSATLGVEYELQLEAAQITGNGDAVSVNLTSAEKLITLVLSSSAAVVDVNGVQYIAEAPTAYVDSNERITFGKGTTNDGGTQYWGYVQVTEAESFTFAYAPNGWNPYGKNTAKHVNIAQDGEIETIQYRDDTDLEFTSVAHTLAEMTTLTGHYTDHMSPGRAFYISPDKDDMTTLYRVKYVERRWRPMVSASTVHRFDMRWRLRITNDEEAVIRQDEEVEMVTLTVDSATPSIAGGTAFTTANTTSTTITNFTGGKAGKIINVVFGDANTIVDGGLTATGMDIPTVAGDTMELLHNGTTWKQIGGSVGMGRFVRVAETNIVDWATDMVSSSTTYTDVALDSYGVRKGAVSAYIYILVSSSSGNPEFYARKNGAASTDARLFSAATTWYNHVIVPLDDDAIFEGKWGGAWTTSVNGARVVGYWI